VLTKEVIRSIGVVRQHIFGIPIDRDVLFANHKNVDKSRIEKRQRKLIIKMPILKRFLKTDERVLLLSTGYSPASTLEKYLVGWLFVYLKRSSFVFTDQRIFHIPTTPLYDYKYAIAQIPYAGCRSLSMVGNTLVVEYTQGLKPDKFFGMANRERKKIGSLLEILKIKANQARLSRRQHLCPRCTSILEKDNYTCPRCQQQFKTVKMAYILAILLPGGGYFYTRQYFLGFIGALIDILLIVTVAYHLLEYLNGNKAALFQLIIFGFGFILEKALTAMQVSGFIKEYIPRKID